MKKGKHSAGKFSVWGNSLLNKLSAVTRNRRKRDASKKRRDGGKEEIREALDEKP